tara:strand:+ start:948 stop:1742 length:795 start_codon:yes stop_codon:yes gene_type:complete
MTFANNEYQEPEVYSIFKKAARDGNITRHELEKIIFAASKPYAPTRSHAGAKFLEALSWYNDIVIGNRDGRFTLRELDKSFEEQIQKYLTTLFQHASQTDRMSAWKMVQKLKILKKFIIISGRNYYPYEAKRLSTVSKNNEWNRKNTITSYDDFQRRVIDASWKKPVLIKFGLTYCVHCLLMENLGSVPAVAKKYKNKLNVYKLWWNPNQPNVFRELNQIASKENVTSSPVFNLYINGRLVKSEYAFPDEDGSGLEDFLKDYIF